MTKQRYRVTYRGANRFKNFYEEISAGSGPEAVRTVYQNLMDNNYFPNADGSICNADGEIIAHNVSDIVIKYDGGYFTAEPF